MYTADLYQGSLCSILFQWKKEEVCQDAFRKPSLEHCQMQQCSLGVSVMPTVSACCELYGTTFCLDKSVLEAAAGQLLHYTTTNWEVITTFIPLPLRNIKRLGYTRWQIEYIWNIGTKKWSRGNNCFIGFQGKTMFWRQYYCNFFGTAVFWCGTSQQFSVATGSAESLFFSPYACLADNKA